ncbi:sigma-54 dependent transcriptional regulator, Fis family protein [Plesiocystis pacifica SIR-1]|uniref:Sigma-54 dependent transcriptional regulator, Fis family protein n=1 Tax=Plesiocystis pacifica SIR-1 TaxID=391625 RepID=A6G4V1_9BACT|nr:sigma 54-interacting transcriptional regulator [Plesiocystis pacifica]EDM79043.1 sigma-54 dependent transcriptional regulator, Fis family protein [Plesiocystis pacifica SIR-1]
MPHLRYTTGGESIRYPLVRRLTTIGSSSDSDIRIVGPDVAPVHATLTHEPGRYRLESTSRSNPFFVNGKKNRSLDLRHGEIFVIGGLELTFSTLDEPERREAPEQKTDEISLVAMRRLQDFSRLLSEPADLDGLLDELIDQVVSLTRASKGFLVLAGAGAPPPGEGEAEGEVDPHRYEIRVARNLAREDVPDPEALLSDDIIREAITTQKPQIISDALHDTRFQNSLSVINLKLSSVMCVPLLVRGELLGLIYVGNNDVVDLFTAAQLETLQVFASQAALFLKNATLLNELRDEKTELADRLEHVKFGSIIGSCPQMIEVYKRVDKVASTDITVLVTGETGTGKELIAHEIHNRSPRAKGPFVTVNCGAIPENLIESELFGHVKGAFTGAVANQVGKFQAADKGTIFLDEIGEMPLALQVKLLRVLQERQIQRVGDAKTVPIDVRVVAATNRDLRKEVEANNFREDLYFRLNVIGIELPPLRERGNDVVLIARYLVNRFAADFGGRFDSQTCFDEGALRAMLKFSWPGNIRQLENHLKKALVLAEGPKIGAADLDLDAPAGAESPETIVPLSEARDRWQREYINKVLALNDGNRTKTARDLGVDPRTIFRHLEKMEKEKREGK